MAMSRSLGSSSLTIRPSIEISPDVMSSSPAIMRSKVLLPQPEGPTKTTNSRSAISRSTPCTTSTSPNDFFTLRRLRPATSSFPLGRNGNILTARWSAGKQMRIGLVGYGGWGRVHASAIGRVEGLSLSGVVAGDDASAREAARDLPGVPVHRTLDALLADPGVELVDIVTPNHLHVDMAVKALAAGKHVLLEKPMATTLADAERLVAAAERSGRHLGIVLQLRVSRQWARVRELIAEGVLGQLRFANLTLFRRPFRRRVRQLAAHPRDRRLVDPRGADPLYRPAAVVLPRARPAGRGVGQRRRLAAGARHGRCLHRDPDASPTAATRCSRSAWRASSIPWCSSWRAIRVRSAPGGRAPWTARTRLTSSSSCSVPAPRRPRSSPSRNRARSSSWKSSSAACSSTCRRARRWFQPREALPSQKVCLEIERALAERRAIALKWP